MPLKEEKGAFMNVITRLNGDDKLKLLRWIAETWNLKDLLDDEDNNSDHFLEEIADELRETVPLTGILPSEIIYEPTDMDKEEKDATLHVDEFLFPDELVDKLVEDEKLSRHYCKDCGSRNIKPLNLLPPMVGKTFLDVGSRLGAVLYGAFIFTDAKKIVGVEINSDWCKHVERISNTRNMQNRIDVICSDVRDHADVISSADVILVSNAFEYFADKKVAEDCWKFMARYIKPGATLILSPRADRTFELYDVGFKWSDWLSELPPHNVASCNDNEDFMDSMAAYFVSKIDFQADSESTK